jgi:hypothetical protein
MADINITITVVFGILSIIMVLFGIQINRVQKQIGVIALMQPLTRNPEAYRMFLEYMSKEWFNKNEQEKIIAAIDKMGLKDYLASAERPYKVPKGLSGEEVALQKILNVMEEINKKL